MSQDTQAPPIGLRSLPRKQVIITLVSVMLAMFISSLDQTVVSTAMPHIIADLGGFSQYTWVTMAYMITSAVTVPIVGKLTDIYGRKIFYICGVAIFILGSVMCGLSHTITQLIFFRGFQGIGAGVMMANAFTVIGDLFPPAVRGKYQGLMSSVFGLSSIIGPTLGGFITDAFSWHWIFFINVPLGLAVIKTQHRLSRRSAADTVRGADVTGPVMGRGGVCLGFAGNHRDIYLCSNSICLFHPGRKTQPGACCAISSF
jgi:multidrug resistance protein